MHEVERLALVIGELMRVAEPATGLHAQVHRLLEDQGAAHPTADLDDLLEVAAIDELHDQEERVVGGADIEDADDVGVVQPRAEARLVEKHPDEVLVLREVRQNAFDRDALLEALDALRFADIDLRHAARFQALDDAISLLCHGVGRAPGRMERIGGELAGECPLAGI